jgi:hypothetical protein
VHHIERERDRPDLRLERSNLIGLCKKHHSAITAREDAFGRRGDEFNFRRLGARTAWLAARSFRQNSENFFSPDPEFRLHRNQSGTRSSATWTRSSEASEQSRREREDRDAVCALEAHPETRVDCDRAARAAARTSLFLQPSIRTYTCSRSIGGTTPA